LKRITIFSKGLKLKIKTMRTKLKNIIPSIWIVEKKSKTNKTFTKGQGEKLKIKKNEDKFREYNILLMEIQRWT
jgi:hypothetical protein